MGSTSYKINKKFDTKQFLNRHLTVPVHYYYNNSVNLQL